MVQIGYTIPVPGLADNPSLGLRRGKFTIKPAEMHAIFEPIIPKIIGLVQGQIRDSGKNIRAILLVGGFGQNNYLKEHIRSAVGTIEVLQPPNAWAAIVRGAVMMGLARSNTALAAISIISRAARKHYGIKLGAMFDASKHLENRR